MWVDAPGAEACWGGARGAGCEARGLPLYSAAAPALGWHLFALLSHFEWISAAFALFYLQTAWPGRRWWAPALLALGGTVACCVPVRGTAVAGEPVLYLVNCALAAWVFHAYREVTHASFQGGDIEARAAPIIGWPIPAAPRHGVAQGW